MSQISCHQKRNCHRLALSSFMTLFGWFGSRNAFAQGRMDDLFVKCWLLCRNWKSDELYYILWRTSIHRNCISRVNYERMKGCFRIWRLLNILKIRSFSWSDCDRLHMISILDTTLSSSETSCSIFFFRLIFLYKCSHLLKPCEDIMVTILVVIKAPVKAGHCSTREKQRQVTTMTESQV